MSHMLPPSDALDILEGDLVTWTSTPEVGAGMVLKVIRNQSDLKGTSLEEAKIRSYGPGPECCYYIFDSQGRLRFLAGIKVNLLSRFDT